MARYARSKSVLLLACALAVAPGYASPKLKVGDTPPPMLGRSVKLSDYRGKVVIISFWASWCPPCRQEMSVLAQIQQVATRAKVEIFAVNWQEDSQRFWQIQRALRKVDLTLISDADGYIGRAYDVDAIPHMVIVGRDGRIAAIHVGYGKEEIPALANEINSLWAQAPASQSPQRTSSPN